MITKREARESARKRQASRRERFREQGFSMVQVWVHESERAKFDAYVAKLRRPK